MRNPWRTASAFGMGVDRPMEVVEEAARLSLIERYDEVKLKKIIAWPETQSAVVIAAVKRLRKLRRKAAK